MIEQTINPQILTWARERIGWDADTFAKKLGAAGKNLGAWERGEKAPTLKQAEDIAKKTRIPFGYLFLDTPPELKMPVADFRTNNFGNITKEDKIKIYDLIQSYKYKLDWYDEYLREMGTNFSSADFQESFSVSDEAGAVAVARDIAEKLNLDELSVNARGRGKPQNFYKNFREQCEKFGLWVVQTGYVGTNNRDSINPHAYSGFALKSDYFPMIWVNSKSYPAVKVFTLAHELAHIWIGAEGVSNLVPADGGVNTISDAKSFNEAVSNIDETEKFCDKVAAELLVPEEKIRERWQRNHDAAQNTKRNFRYFGVSQFVLLKRAYDLKLIDFSEYQKTWGVLRQGVLDFKKKEQEKKKEGGGDFYQNLLLKNGRNFSEAVIGSAFSEDITLKEAMSLLGVTTFSTLEKYKNWLEKEEEEKPSDDLSD